MKTISVGMDLKTCVYYITERVFIILQGRNVKKYLHMQSIEIISLSHDIIKPQIRQMKQNIN